MQKISYILHFILNDESKRIDFNCLLMTKAQFSPLSDDEDIYMCGQDSVIIMTKIQKICHKLNIIETDFEKIDLYRVTDTFNLKGLLINDD